MTSDVYKLNLKDKLEQQEKNLEQYNEHDVQDFPGYTFLLSQVVKAYGVCPYLNVYDPDCKTRRVTWLEEQSDKGAVYFKTVKDLTDDDLLHEVETKLMNNQELLKSHVVEALANVEPTTDFDIDHDLLVNSIKMRKEAKSVNKKVKEARAQTNRILDYIMMKCGIDFNRYVQIVFGFSLKYKAPIIELDKIDEEFTKLCGQCLCEMSKYSSMKSLREREKSEAMSQLAKLIEQQFKLSQIGKYFQKWSGLSQEKKEDRIKSYCDWYARQHSFPLSFSDDMKTYILDQLQAKNLKASDIKWESKMGIISSINIVVNEDVTFDLVKRAPRVLKTRRTSKKKRDEIFQTDEQKELMQRINRLIFYEIIKGKTSNKEAIMKTVMYNLHSRLLPESQVIDFISVRYDDILAIVKNNKVQAT